jgi:hypothetical protein
MLLILQSDLIDSHFHLPQIIHHQIILVCSNLQIKKDKINRTRSTYMGNEKCIKMFCGILQTL